MKHSFFIVFDNGADETYSKDNNIRQI